MSSELKTAYYAVARMKQLLLDNNNVDLLLFLAKYNPNVTRKRIETELGKDALKDLDSLKQFDLIVEDSKGITLTHEGIFQIDGLVSMLA